MSASSVRQDKIISLAPCPRGLSLAYETLFSEDALRFLTDLVTTFDQQSDKVIFNTNYQPYTLVFNITFPYTVN